MNLGDELLAVAAQRDLSQLDEKLYFEVFAKPQTVPAERKPATGRRSRAARR